MASYHTYMNEVVKKRDSSKKMTALFVLCGLLFVGLIILGVLLFTRRGGEVSSRAKSEDVIQKVEKLYITPSSETPTVAEIRDKDNLPKEQEFYKDVRNGDFLLVYNKARIAILYRESINKLVRVSPVIPTDVTKETE